MATSKQPLSNGEDLELEAISKDPTFVERYKKGGWYRKRLELERKRESFEKYRYTKKLNVLIWIPTTIAASSYIYAIWEKIVQKNDVGLMFWILPLLYMISLLGAMDMEENWNETFKAKTDLIFPESTGGWGFSDGKIWTIGAMASTDLSDMFQVYKPNTIYTDSLIGYLFYTLFKGLLWLGNILAIYVVFGLIWASSRINFQ